MFTNAFRSILFVFILVISSAAQNSSLNKDFNGIMQAQIALINRGFSTGAIDGFNGFQMREAVRGFQQNQKLTQTGELDTKTRQLLTLKQPLTKYRITAQDLQNVMPVPKTWIGKSEAKILGYETVLELVTEKFHAHTNLIKRLNPKIDWSKPKAGTEVVVPNVVNFRLDINPEILKVSVSRKIIQVFNKAGKLVAQFPCSIARDKTKTLEGELTVANFAENPNYTFSPETFPDESKAEKIDKKIILPPGANNPVGLVWIGLSKPTYGIHGTPMPELIGRTESHGCFRLANWDAKTLVRMVKAGMPVKIIR